MLFQPIFQDPPEHADEGWTHGVIVGGMASSDLLIARAFKRAGDVLVEDGLNTGQAHEIAYPILNAYRHSIELYLKLIVNPDQRNHKLDNLFLEFEAIVARDHGQSISPWARARLKEFIEIDPNSFSFRYAKDRHNREFNVPTEYWVELKPLQAVLTTLTDGFEQVICEMRKIGPSGTTELSPPY